MIPANFQKTTFAFIMLALLSINPAQAQSLSVETIQIGTAVENRELIGADTTFAPSVEQLYCFTHITGAQDTTEIYHVWYYQDEEKARVSLQVRSNNWRTWSSKSILSSWTGPWRVMIEDADGNVLATENFTIKE